MNQTWQIRKATQEDSDGLKYCMESAYATYQERMKGERLPPMDVDYSQEIRDYPTWVIESRGTILGGLIMSFANNKASIANIAVDPKLQGHGIGGALVRFAEKKQRKMVFLICTSPPMSCSMRIYRFTSILDGKKLVETKPKCL